MKRYSAIRRRGGGRFWDCGSRCETRGQGAGRGAQVVVVARTPPAPCPLRPAPSGMIPAAPSPEVCMASAKAITDHDEIRRWVEQRGGHPARVKSTGQGKDPGVLRIDYPGYSGEGTLERMPGAECFEWFTRGQRALL